MGTCVSKCYSCSTAGAGADDRSLPGSPTKPRNHALAVHPLPLPAAYASSPTSTSASLLSVSATSSTSTSTIVSSTSSSRPPRPFSTDYLKALPCRDMEVVVLDPNPNKKKKLSTSVTTPRPLPRKPLSVVRSPRKQPSSHIPSTSKRVRLLPGAPPPAAAPRKRVASCRLAASTATSKSRVPPFPRGKSAMATDAGVAGAGAGPEDDLNNPVISMDCFIFL